MEPACQPASTIKRQVVLRQHMYPCTCPQAVKELESLHVAAAEELEGLYEARLALEQERLAQLQAAKDDLELSLKVRIQNIPGAGEGVKLLTR